MYLRTDTDEEFPEPDDDTVEKVIRGLLQNPDESSAILIESEERNSFMQTYPSDAFTFCVEFHVGLGTDSQHYRLENVSIETVLALFQSFNAGETSWKNDYPWIDVTSEMAAGDGLTQFQEETGRSVGEWLQLIWQSGPKDKNARKEWPKAEHGLSGSRSAMLARFAAPEMEDLVNRSKELEDSKNRLKDSKTQLEANLEALIERSISAMRDGNEQGIEDCGKLVERLRTLLKTTDGDSFTELARTI